MHEITKITWSLADRAERISSRQNQFVAEAAALSDASERRRQGLFLLDGIKLTLETLSSELRVRHIFLTERAAEKYSDAILPVIGHTRVLILSDAAFDRVTDERAPEGVVAVVECSDSIVRDYDTSSDDCKTCGLILDGIQNPENFGAILRSARAFGVGNVVVGNVCADAYGRRVMRSSMSAVLHIGVLRANDLADVCRRIAASGRRVVAAVPREGAVPLTEFAPRGDDCVVIGNEGHGISRDVLDASTDAVYIPMAKGQESLNAAAATAVILWEFYKNKLR